jgi:hypothetical protein
LTRLKKSTYSRPLVENRVGLKRRAFPILLKAPKLMTLPVSHRFLHVVCLLFSVATSVWADDMPPCADWRDDYAAARDTAKSAGKQFLVWFYDRGASDENERFRSTVLADAAIASRVAEKFIAAEIPTDARSDSAGRDGRLIEHEAFAELRGRPGLAIVDFASPAAASYGCVVSVYPFTRGAITVDRLAVLLDLPTGTLSQRTLIFAVRTHADRPASAAGEMHPVLASEAAAHALHQASLNVQGHHNWSARFHAINARLPAGHVAYEVCAESWPGQPLLEAAEECVASWRQSSGHWGQVSRQAEYYGYDMHRSASGVWYATGIFGRRR